MANIKSAKKRIKITQKKTLKNKIIKTKTKTAIKKLTTAIESGDKSAAQSALPDATRAINKAASKGVLHKNTASRKVSRLTKAVNKMSA